VGSMMNRLGTLSWAVVSQSSLSLIDGRLRRFPPNVP
jgi:hypothetical protein